MNRFGRCHGIRIHAGGPVEDDTRRVGLSLSGSTALARHFLCCLSLCKDVSPVTERQTLLKSGPHSTCLG
jgi:hypothetical protein